MLNPPLQAALNHYKKKYAILGLKKGQRFIKIETVATPKLLFPDW